MTHRPHEPTGKDSWPSFAKVDYEDWLRTVGVQPDGARQSVEGVELEPLCSLTHPPRSNLSIPVKSGGEDPGSPWVVCQAFADSSPEKLNQRLKSNLANGVAGVRLRFDQGAGLSSVSDFRQAFGDVDQDWRMLMLDSGTQFLPAVAVLLSWLGEAALVSTGRYLLFAADPLRVLAENGNLSGSLATLTSDGAALVRYSSAELANGRALAVSTEPYREAGADIDQELAVAMAVAVQYLRAMEQHGLQPDMVAPEIAFVTATGQQTFFEIAKIRALRLLWDGVQKLCGVKAPSPAWIHSTVLQRSLPQTDPATDLLRLTTASMAAVVGGADSVETPGQPIARLGDGAEGGRRLARNTQHILELEAHLGRVRDPGGGSYLIETLTHQLAAKAWTIFQEIEGRGGALDTLSTGWLQDQIAERWQKRARLIEMDQIQLLGVNVYTDQGGMSELPRPAADGHRTDDSDRTARTGSNSESRTAPEGDRWEWALKCANQGVSVQEMSRALYGSAEHHAVRPLLPHRDSQPFASESERP